MLKISLFAPKSHVEQVKKAMFDAGGGRIGNYDQCCWQVLGQGQFRPCEGSQPFYGKQGAVEQVEEFRVEMVCEDNLLHDVIAAMREAHPYEEPAYDVIQTVDV